MTIVQIAEIVGLVTIVLLMFIITMGIAIFFFLIIPDQYRTLKTIFGKNGNSKHGQT